MFCNAKLFFFFLVQEAQDVMKKIGLRVGLEDQHHIYICVITTEVKNQDPDPSMDAENNETANPSHFKAQ